VDNNAPLYLLVRKPKAPSNAHDADFDTEPVVQPETGTTSSQASQPSPQPEPEPSVPVPAPVEEYIPQSLPDLNAPPQQ